MKRNGVITTNILKRIEKNQQGVKYHHGLTDFIVSSYWRILAIKKMIFSLQKNQLDLENTKEGLEFIELKYVASQHENNLVPTEIW